MWTDIVASCESIDTNKQILTQSMQCVILGVNNMKCSVPLKSQYGKVWTLSRNLGFFHDYSDMVGWK